MGLGDAETVLARKNANFVIDEAAAEAGLVRSIAAPGPFGMRRHFKGNHYEVLLVARDVETEEPVVVYQALYGEQGHWVRTLADFTAHVTRDGYDGPRFVPVGDGQVRSTPPR